MTSEYIERRVTCYFYRTLLLCCIVILSCCNNEEIGLDTEFINPNINFIGLVENPEKISTKATSSTQITSSFFNCNFFINVSGQNGLGESREKWSKLVIPSGASGSLMIVEDIENPFPVLNWFSRDHAHYFYGWTSPWTTEYDPREQEMPTEIMVPFQGSNISEITQSSTNNSISWKTGTWKNGEILEKFVGALSGPLDYISNGQFVEMQFRHMVSKIFISNFAVVDNVNGTSSTNLRGEITFYGLPDEVPFYTTPRDLFGLPQKPHIPKPEEYGWNYDQSNGVTYVITNYSQSFTWQGNTNGNASTSFNAKDCFYIPPELDLSKLSFKIQIYEYINNKEWIPSTIHGIHGAYYGDFSRVSFSRTTTGSNYDNYPYDGDDLTRLHAGEYLSLSINLYENGEPSIRGTITSWRSWNDRDASQHVEDGIYSIEDLYEFSDLMSSSNLNEDKLHKREEFHQNHGGLTTDDDDKDLYPNYSEQKKVIKLYEDISGWGSSLYVDKDYIFDGQGHTINVNSTSLTIGQVRDVYFRYYTSSPYIEYIIYIDKKGNVFIVDPETYRETPTECNVNDYPNPLKINLSTGEIS